MPADTAVDQGTSSAIGALVRALGFAVLAIGTVLALMFAFAAALVVGLMIAGAAVAMRIWPQRNEPEILEARRTPAGWVVESAAKRKS
jgi:hypothetical protein